GGKAPGRGGDRRVHARGTRGPLSRAVRGRTGYALLPRSGLDDRIDCDRPGPRENPARYRCGPRRSNDREGRGRAVPPAFARSTSEGEAGRQPDRCAGLLTGTREPRGEPGRPPTDRDAERDRRRDARQARDDAGAAGRHGRCGARRGIPPPRVSVRPDWISHVEAPPDPTLTRG